MKKINMNEFRQSTYDIDPVFINRWSPRAFQTKEVPDDVLFSLFEAARFAPSAGNLQPWRFMIARSEKEKERFYSFIMEGNLLWCKTAPVLALLLSKASTEHGPNISHEIDAGAAWSHLSIAAAQKGLITRAMGGFYRAQARALLHIPEDYDPLLIIAIGYQADKEILPESLQDREIPTGRRSLDEILFENEFGRPVKRS